MEGNRLQHLLVFASLIGVMGLFAYSLSLAPIEMDVGDISENDVGSIVRIRGTLATAWRTSGGGLNMILTDGGSYIRVYAPERASPDDIQFLPGSVVSVKGEVQLYEGELEIYVSSGADIRVEKEPKTASVSPGILAEMPEAFAGETLRVHGSIQSIRVLKDEDFRTIGTSFDLTSDGYRISCIVFGWDWDVSPMGIDEDVTTIFEATWEYYSGEASWQLVSNEPSFRH